MAPAASARRDELTTVDANYIFGGLSLVFLALAVRNLLRGGRASHPQTRTWFIIGAVFGVVALWLTVGR